MLIEKDYEMRVLEVGGLELYDQVYLDFSDWFGARHWYCVIEEDKIWDEAIEIGRWRIKRLWEKTFGIRGCKIQWNI